MGRRILIVDDDANFNQLLTDIFSQASYEVESCEDPEKAFDRFCSTDFDLVVTDQKMPGLTGEELIRLLKKEKPNVPIIMVSGYLDNDTIRNLIKEGVGGVFLKPLNVFSLLKRTSALIEEREAGLRRETGGGDGEDGKEEEVFHHKLPFSFETFPAKDKRSRDFAQKLYDIRDFKTNLVLVAPRGSDLAAITADLNRFDSGQEEEFRLLDRGEITQQGMEQHVADGQQKGLQRLTLIVAAAETVSREQYSLIMRVGRKKEPFDDMPFPVRFVFCVGRDLDLLYDERVIDDAVYMFMGTAEVRVPNLAEIPNDIPELARRYLDSESTAHGLAKPPRLTMSAKTYLREQPWSGNAGELHRFIRMAIHMDSEHLGMEDLERVEKKLNSSAGGHSLRQSLTLYRDEYVQAVSVLLDGDRVATGEVLGVDERLIKRVLN